MCNPGFRPIMSRPPTASAAQGQGHVVGWKVEATFPNIKTGVLEWHGGFVFDFAEKQLESGARTFSYRLFFPIDANDEWVHPPFNDKALCFRKPHLPNTNEEEDE